MDGKIVQLIQGERKVLEFDSLPEWIDRFREFPIVQVIDLDAAMGKGSNQALVKHLCAELSCQVGGGLRSLEAARQPLSWGAERVIIGSSLFSSDEVNINFAKELAEQRGPEQLIFAVDASGGYVTVQEWK